MKMLSVMSVALLLWCAPAVLAVGEVAGTTAQATTETEAEEQSAENADAPEEFDEQKFMVEYRQLLTSGKFDEADKQLKAALEKQPDSDRLQSLHYPTYYYLRSAKRNEQAFDHLKAHVDRLLKMAADNPAYVETYSQFLGMLIDFGSTLGGTDRAVAILDESAKRAQELGGSVEQIAAVETQRAIHLGKTERTDEARSLIDAQVRAATERLAQAADDAESILRMANALKNRVKLESAIEDGASEKAWAELLDFLFAQAQAHGDVRPLTQRFESEHLIRAGDLARTQPDEAEALLVRIDSFKANQAANAAEDDTSAILLGGRSPIARIRAQIEKTRKMLALVGSPAMYPEDVDGWANGEALTAESLKGKVVLLDFFAVWCGPCIATFPHLREWHDEFAGKGLQIVGVTNYEQYGWDTEAGRAAPQADIEPEAERSAMDQFAKHHELRHPIAFVAGRELHDFYGVSGIPHAAIIDGAGKVRLFRIGSGDTNAADLKQAIEECLAESPAAEQSAGS